MQSASNRLFRDDFVPFGPPHPARRSGAEGAGDAPASSLAETARPVEEPWRQSPVVTEDEDDDSMFDNMPV
jgi:hypothetical protein